MIARGSRLAPFLLALLAVLSQVAFATAPLAQAASPDRTPIHICGIDPAGGSHEQAPHAPGHACQLCPLCVSAATVFLAVEAPAPAPSSVLVAAPYRLASQPRAPPGRTQFAPYPRGPPALLT